MKEINHMTTRKLLNITLVMVSSVFLCTTVFAQQTRIAEMNNNGSSVSFEIKVPYQSATLTVSSPDGKIFRKEFPEGTIPVFSPDNENGVYKYELTLSPAISDDVKKRLEKAREKGNGETVAARLRKRGLLPAPMIQSGSFSLADNQLITGDDGVTETDAIQSLGNTKQGVTTEATDGGGGVTPEANVVNQDQVVLGSLCVGFDCPSSPNFGFDTIRLQENNLRIHFEDTSNSASFPKNDWRITINDSANGGDSFFSIDDVTGGRVPFKIEAGAPSNSLYVEDSGDIGIGTSTPVVELHVKDGDTPTIRLEQDGSSGFNQQTWDIAGNETNFFIRDVNNSSRLPFRIRPNAPTSSIDIQADGTIKTQGKVESSNTAIHFFGGNGSITPDTVANATVDLNSNGVGPTTGVQGNVNIRWDIHPYGLNGTGDNIEYKIRYLDSDGTANTNSRIRLSVFQVDISTGGFSSDQFFDSNSNGATTTNTVTVCKSRGSLFDFGNVNRGMYLTALIQNKSTSGNTQLFQVSMRRVISC
jgi:hypothetical protein